MADNHFTARIKISETTYTNINDTTYNNRDKVVGVDRAVREVTEFTVRAGSEELLKQKIAGALEAAL